jgi:hypothetical protein
VGATAVALAAALTVIPLVPQLPRDYLLNLGQDTSHFDGSSYVRLLRQLGPPGEVVETDYISSTALFTGHDTHGYAFTAALSSCDPRVIRAALTLDDAGFLLLGDVNKPGILDSPCLFSTASASTWAVLLLHTSQDNASVFELIGPGSGHPDLQDLTAAATKTSSASEAGRVWEWDWGTPRTVTQVSVGEAGRAGTTTAVTLQILQVDGAWHTVAASRAALGDGPNVAPYLLATLPAGTEATAVRVVIAGSGMSPAATVAAPAPADVEALGPGPGS